MFAASFCLGTPFGFDLHKACVDLVLSLFKCVISILSLSVLVCLKKSFFNHKKGVNLSIGYRVTLTCEPGVEPVPEL